MSLTASGRYYRRNRKERIADTQARAARGRALIRAAKDRPCADCRRSYPHYVLDFDHVRGTKTGIPSTMLTYSVARIEAELAKCEVVCANCHRERTHQRGQAGRPRKELP